MSWHNTAHRWDGLIWEGVVVVWLYVKVYCGVDELGAGSNEIETMAKDQGQGQQGGHPNGDLL